MTSRNFRMDTLLAGTLILLLEGSLCRCDVQRRRTCRHHSGLDRENDSGKSEKPFAFPLESLFTFSPESCSPSSRNAFHVHPGRRSPSPGIRSEPPNRSINAAMASGAGTTVTYGNGAYFTFGNNRFEGKKLPVTIIADALSRFADRPVVDMTGLKGNYDFSMEFSPEDFRAMMIRATIASGTVVPPEVLKLLDASSGDTLVNAVEKLGLKLESRKAPIEMLVIDEAQKTPTEN
jgi:hypothetical protein